MILSRQEYVHTSEQLVTQPSASEVEMSIEKLKGHRSPGIDQIPAELIKAGCRTIHYELHKLINSIWNNEELQQWKELIIVPVYKKGDETDAVIIEALHFCQVHTKFYLTSCCQSELHMQRK